MISEESQQKYDLKSQFIKTPLNEKNVIDSIEAQIKLKVADNLIVTQLNKLLLLDVHDIDYLMPLFDNSRITLYEYIKKKFNL